MPPNERHHPLPTKGIPMLIDMILAIFSILAVGVAFNYIGHLVTK